MQTIGIVGCGLMGYGIATNLVRKGYVVKVYDTNPEAVKRVVDEGADGASSVPELARWSDVLILSLPSTELVEKVLVDGKEGALPHMKYGSAVLDMSTNDVARTRLLEEAAGVIGVSYFDCPVSGGPDGAITGSLTIMVGGSEEKFSQVSSVLQAMGGHVEYIGSSGAGQIVKLCNNMVVGGIISLLSEALLTGERAGVSKEKLAELFQKGSGQTRVMEVFGPTIINETFDDVTFSMANMRKDLSLYRNLAKSEGLPTAISDAAFQLFTRASSEGDNRRDATAVAELLAHEIRR
ncbi:NAD(P)-dependent oxidoreductase [Sporosarcina gallistercoris]|uniref:NAD(P)-dependent oxidoreductase n=1 Tax=Sporosarcina gallistercoris TaxID=2762245 RepID=A0ABR8PLM7_9BACL|nr:NAD(P)-dependent oxidoreductase [Sporosarcina gallistercoris]MBD7909079.1 NAD(P)-dependent oxidoreductase [Sporosarcina gallistercoris]